jgi:thiamine-phosphate pyrophosphorylase
VTTATTNRNHHPPSTATTATTDRHHTTANLSARSCQTEVVSSHESQPGGPLRERLRRARLYLVCDSQPGDRALAPFLREAIAGGVEVVQLRDKRLDDGALVEAVRAARAVCAAQGVPLIVNDRPRVALAAGADGVHVGQEDMPVAQVRELVGEELLIGLSTHRPAEIDAAASAGVDYIGVGPVHATPTKPGRPAVGLELVRYAAAHAHMPFFAIGGIDAGNVQAVRGAGAMRVAVVRAVAAAADPQAAARALRDALEDEVAAA